MSNVIESHVKSNLSIKLETYIKAIIDKYGTYIPKETLNKIQNITDYKEIIKIYDYGSVNAFASKNEISLPLCADKLLKIASKIPGYGIYKNHKTYNEKNLVINNNTYITYLLHAFISGTDAEGYYEDMLLHETMHFCGGKGGLALKEGINEFLTRKIAKESNFKTNGCGYPKEVKIANELQNLFGEEIIDQIAFLENHDTFIFLRNKLGFDVAILYLNISQKMEEEFYDKYYSNIDSYSGLKGIAKKTIDYQKINYSEIYKMIEKYKLENSAKKEKKMSVLNRREQELLESGLVKRVANQFANKNVKIPEEYYLLIADYLDCLSQIENIDINILNLMQRLPEVITEISEKSTAEIGNIFGKTSGKKILMNENNDYETNKLYFFHELTHALQTTKENGIEKNCFLDSSKGNGMFFTEGLTQKIGELTYNISNHTNNDYKYQKNINCQPEHTTYSDLSLYQLNESFLTMFSQAIGMSVKKMIGLSFEKDFRNKVERKFNEANNNEADFESFMDALEEIYTVNKLTWQGEDTIKALSGNVLCEIEGDYKIYKSNLSNQNRLIKKVQEQMINMFFKNNNESFVKNNKEEFYKRLTTPELKEIFNIYDLNWKNEMQNQRQIMSEFISDYSEEYIFKYAEKLKKSLTNNALKKEFDTAINGIKNLNISESRRPR